MSATIHTMPPRVPFAPAHVAGVPAGARADADSIGAAAFALAHLAGENWDQMTPSRLDEYRRLAVLAVCLASPESVRLACYHIEHVRACSLPGASMANETPQQRLRHVEAIAIGLRMAADALYGLRPVPHAHAVALMEQDELQRTQRVW